MIILLMGPNGFATRQALDKLVADMVARHGVHAIERVEGESLDLSRLPDLLQGGSLFASERLVILRDASKNKPLWEALGDWADKVPAEITFVVLDQTPDKRTRTFKQFQKHAKVHEFLEMNEYELAKWASSVAKEAGGSLDAKTATYLVRQVGTDQWRLWSELQKLLASDLVVTAASIDELVEPNLQASVFELLDAALAGNGLKMMELLARLRASEDPYKLFGLLVSQVQTLALVVAAQGRQAEVVAKEAAVHPFVVRKMQPLTRSITIERLRKVVASVARTDMQMKSTGVDPWVLLEQCLGKIASIVL